MIAGMDALIRWVMLAMTWFHFLAPHPLSSDMTEQAARAHLQPLVQEELNDMVHHRLAALKNLYVNTPDSQHALQVAEVRSDYLTRWAKMRGIQWTGVTTGLHTDGVWWISPTRIRFSVWERENYHYHYRSLAKKPLSFGIASRHQLSIVDDNGTWRFATDDFFNPVLPDDMAGQTVPQQFGGPTPRAQLSPNRQKAVAYAEEFCGNAPGCGNGGRYNAAYQDYNGNGGDCTNWISQVLWAGGFRMTSEWSYDQDTDEGSPAWSNARVLADFMSRTGRASLIASGSYASITHGSTEWPHGPIQTLIPGDLISYKEKGRIVHTAVVIGYDPKGVLLTDTHSNDRFHVPWDFGWSDKTVFFLWRVHYPGETK